LGGRDKLISEFEASLVYRVSSRTARATQRTHTHTHTKEREREKRERKEENTQTHVEVRIGTWVLLKCFILFVCLAFGLSLHLSLAGHSNSLRRTEMAQNHL
jgi:hypothetical protein